MNSSILKFQNVWKTFGENDSPIDSLNGIDLEIENNSSNLILGPSGSGKSTLLSLVSLLDTPTKGKILINGKNTENLSKPERSRIRRAEIGIIHQRDNLFPFLSILENITLPMFKHDKKKAMETLKRAGLNEIAKFPHEISVEDQQKATLARALINNPSLLLADEPTGELNRDNTNKLMNLIKDVGSECTVLIVSNNQELIKYCDNVLYLKDGIIK